MSDFWFNSGRFPKKLIIKVSINILEIIKSSIVMMGSLVSMAKASQFVIAIVRSEDFNIVVLILVMVHALVNVLNGNLV